MNHSSTLVAISTCIPQFIRRLFGALILISLSVSLSFSQDIHWTQVPNAPIHLNPALTGVFKGDVRFIGNYRSQWNQVPVKYMTFSGGADMKFYHRRWKHSMFGGGILFNYDQAGDSKLSTTQISLNGSYTHQLTKSFFISVGVQGAFYQRGFKIDELQFDEQYNGDVHDPSLPHNETFDNTSIGFGDFSAGLNVRYQKPDTRTKLDLGFGWFHFNKPNRSFWEPDQLYSESELPHRHSIYGLGVLQLAKKFDLVVNGMGQIQGPHSEIVLGAAGRIHLNQTRTKELAIQLGLYFRVNEELDALAPAVELHYKAWRFGLSYDVNMSDFNIATDRFGGPEFSIRYIITKVRPLAIKICPII